MVSQKNVLTVKDVSEQLVRYPVIGVIDMFKLPASQLHHIRNMLRGKAVIRMVKKSLIILALKESGIRGIESLGDTLQGEPALIMTEMDPFRLARLISESKSEAPAKEGDIAPRDIEIKAGPTSLPPGPVIGELQKAKIPAMIQGDKIHVREDTMVSKRGDVIGGVLAGVLSKLGIMPMEIGLNMLAAWENGTIYGKDILFIPPESYVNDMVSAHQRAFNLALNTGYPTSETVPLLLSRAHQEALNLATSADILTSETIKPIIAKAHARMEALRARAGMAEEAKEEAPAGEEPKEETQPEEGKEAAPAEKKKDESEEPTQATGSLAGTEEKPEEQKEKGPEEKREEEPAQPQDEKKPPEETKTNKEREPETGTAKEEPQGTPTEEGTVSDNDSGKSPSEEKSPKNEKNSNPDEGDKKE